MNDYFNIDLTELENQNYRGCNSSMLAMMTEAASVCLGKHNHNNPVYCSAEGLFTKDYIIKYKTVDDSMLATYMIEIGLLKTALILSPLLLSKVIQD